MTPVIELPELIPVMTQARHWFDTCRGALSKKMKAGDLDAEWQSDSDFQRWAASLLAPHLSCSASLLTTAAGGVHKPHIDRFNRQASINIPVYGDWAHSPLQYYQGDEVVFEHRFIGCPVLIDTTRVHGVDNRDSARPRSIITIGIFPPASFSDLVRLQEAGELFAPERLR